MALPGTTVTIVETTPARTAPTDTSAWFVTGLADKGKPVPTLVRSISEFTTKFGARVSYSLLYDALDVFFREGGARAWVSRVVGPGAVSASFMLKDAAVANTLLVTAISPGDWGNLLNVAVLAGDAGGEFKLQISHDTDGILETSPSLVDKTAAIAWAQSSSYVTLTDQASTQDPAVVAAQSLTGGTDDRASITNTDWKTALDRFSRQYGPGQVSMPGRTTDQAHIDTLAHAAANNRAALLDAPDTATVATLTGSAVAARASGRYGALFAPWAIVPGIVGATTRTVPYSAVQAGIIARNDGASASRNRADAGPSGRSLFALGLSQPAWTEGDGGQRETLNDAGVNVARLLDGQVVTYGYRSLANPATDPAWVQFTMARAAMAIAAAADAIGETYMFSQLDGRGITTSAFAGDLSGMLVGFYNAGDLYGASAADAFAVNVGADINTPETLAAGELRAALSVRPSPFAEMVEILITKRVITEGVA